MSPEAVAIFSSIVTLVGTVVTVSSGNKKIQAELDKHNAVQDTRIEELTREVREHNNFATTIPVLEHRISEIERRLNNEQ